MVETFVTLVTTAAFRANRRIQRLPHPVGRGVVSSAHHVHIALAAATSAFESSSVDNTLLQALHGSRLRTGKSAGLGTVDGTGPLREIRTGTWQDSSGLL